jgi:quaternary ammonium compound-resistance protein SugE
MSFWLLTLSLDAIPLGTAYAVWTGIGAFGTAVVGMLYFRDPVTIGRVFFMIVLIAAIVGLKIFS